MATDDTPAPGHREAPITPQRIAALEMTIDHLSRKLAAADRHRTTFVGDVVIYGRLIVRGDYGETVIFGDSLDVHSDAGTHVSLHCGIDAAEVVVDSGPDAIGREAPHSAMVSLHAAAGQREGLCSGKPESGTASVLLFTGGNAQETWTAKGIPPEAG